MAKQDSDGYALSDTTAIHDLQAAQYFLASYDYSPATVGIQNCLVRHTENEQFIKFSQCGTTIENCLAEVNQMEKSLSSEYQLDIERCAMITRLRRCLENRESFQNILNQNQYHLNQSMRDDPAPSCPNTFPELIQQCQQRNVDAMKLHLAHRMGRLQFHDNNPTKPSMNIINLQKWIQTHSQLLMNIPPTLSNPPQLDKNLQDLLMNSFFIIQHPSPTIVTYSKFVNGGVTAKINSRIVYLLDRLQPNITIDNIKPYVRRMATYNQAEEPNILYEQAQLDWKTYSVITASNNYSTFSCGCLSEISLKQPLITSPDQKLSTGKPRYSPLVYCIDFVINVTISYPSHQIAYQAPITVQSAPFGLVTNTSQNEHLFAKVFIEDIRYWKFYQTNVDTMSNSVNTSPVPMNLTIDDIVKSVERYFIHKTGIRPKEWIIPYVQNVLELACQNQSDSIEISCHNCLVKILAQIDYMAEHPLLSFFHYDGLFLGICDDYTVDQILLKYRQFCQKSVCAIRFGAISRMSDLKEIGIRVMLVDKSSNNIQPWKFDTKKLSMELGLYIIKIFLCEASRSDSILINLYPNTSLEYDESIMTNITKFVDLYHSEKLMAICPHKEKYPSIWIHTYNNQNTTTEGNNDLDNQSYATNQLQPHYSEQPSEPQTTQINIQSSPVIIVVNNRRNAEISNDDVMQLVNNGLPQYSQLFQLSSIFRFDAN